MVAITRSNDYNARIVRDIMDTANSFIYLVYIIRISLYDDSICYIDIIEIC